jgi:hypothetical protein
VAEPTSVVAQRETLISPVPDIDPSGGFHCSDCRFRVGPLTE